MFYPKTPFIGRPLVESEILKINAHLLPQLLPWLCETPKITTYRVNTLRTTPAAYKEKLQKLLVERYGSEDKAPKVYSLPELPEMLCIGSIKVTSLTPDSSSSSLKEVIVDSCCGAALLRGAHIYAPGVLAMEPQTQLNDQVAVYADLEGKCKRGAVARYESETKMFIGCGEALMQRYQLYNPQHEALEGIAVEMKSNISGVPSLGDLSDGEALLQNLPSIVCARVLAPQRGELVLDMCAAPGNKTTHLAELMAAEGRIIALDNSVNRVRAMQSRLASYNIIESHHFDATKSHDPQLEVGGGGTPTLPPFPSASFDRILLDAPCSGLGNRPQLCSAIKQVKVLQSYPKIQRRLLTQAAELLRPGGVLVYSTCTIAEAECEEIVAWALNHLPQLRLVDAVPKFGGPGWPGLGLDDRQCEMLQRFGPEATNRVRNLDTVGFFIAKFEKI